MLLQNHMVARMLLSAANSAAIFNDKYSFCHSIFAIRKILRSIEQKKDSETRKRFFFGRAEMTVPKSISGPAGPKMTVLESISGPAGPKMTVLKSISGPAGPKMVLNRAGNGNFLALQGRKCQY